MPPITFETFDLTPYQRAPRGNVRALISVARALAELAPRDDAKSVERTAAGLEAVIAEAEDGLAARHIESVPTDGSEDTELDGCVDTLWSALRGGLEAKAAFDHPGLSRLLGKHGKRSAIGSALRAGQEQATRARKLIAQLFRDEGLAFTQKPFPEQVVRMATILRIVDEQGLAPEIDALLGPETLVALRAFQPEYETMVEGRLSRDARRTSDLNVLRGRLGRAIVRHCNAVLALLDENVPETLPLVMQALRPIDVFRAKGSVSTKAATGSGTEGAEARGAEAEAEAEALPAE